MNEKYLLLIKHFLQKSNSEEEKLVADYKAKNATEYEALKTIWEQKTNIDIIDFDTESAWQKVKQLKNKNKAKKVSLFNMRTVAMVASVVLLIAFAGYGFYQTYSTQDFIVQQNNTNTPTIIHLPDSSKISLNKNATIRYAKSFNQKERIVYLNGEAFFEVSKNPQRPFIVKMKDSEVKVLGTSFNINTSKDSTQVIVATGKVEVTATQLKQSIFLLPGNSAHISKQKLNSFTTHNPNYLAWKTGIFTFENTSFEQVVKDLNTYYSEKIITQMPLKNTCSLTAYFKEKELEEIIEILALSCAVKFEKENNTYKIQQ